MKYLAQVNNTDSLCSSIKTLEDTEPDWTSPHHIFISVPTEDTTLIGQFWNGTDFVAPPLQARYLLTLDEWVDTWTLDEWENLQGAAYERGYVVDWTGHPLDGVAAPQATQRRLRQLFDAIRLTNSFDIRSVKAYDFYDYLTLKTFTTAARQIELQAGILE